MINRRSFNKLLLGTTAISFAACMPAQLSSLGEKKRVVVIGGGFGGATAAKYVKKFDSSVEVVLIEKNTVYHTCPFSNTVIGGLNDISFIAHDYKTLAKKYGIKVIHKMATTVNADAKKVILENGDEIAYSKLVVSPGIDFKYEKGYEPDSENYAPHAYKAGSQTTLLRKQLEDMKDGGTFVMVSPKNPFRCPPGPYERISLVANYLKENKPKSKIVILDQKAKFSKQGLFTEGWDNLYSGIIDWRSSEFGGEVVSVNPKTKVVETVDGDVQADVLNYIPNQKAGKIAFSAGLTKGDWCPINPMTFESTIKKDVYVIGDASIASAMPKSGFSASSQAKIAALQIVAKLKGLPEITPPKFANTCYSLVAPEYGISVAAVYQANSKNVGKVKGAGGLSPMGASDIVRAQEAEFAVGWYKNQTADMFL